MSTKTGPDQKDPPGRLLGLDVGSKRIGVAISDPLRLSARPLTTLERGAGSLDEIAALVSEWEVEAVVVGRPLRLDGSPSAVTTVVETLVGELKSRFRLPVYWADERLSSKEAERWMSREGIPPAQRRPLRDQYAATLILQWYLEESRG